MNTAQSLPPHVYQQYPQSPQSIPAPKGTGLGATALVLGILSLALCWVPVVNIVFLVCGVVGFVLGVVGIFVSHRVMSSVGAGLAIVGIVLTCVVNTSFATEVDRQLDRPGSVGAAPAQQPVDQPAAETGSNEFDTPMPTEKDFTVSLETMSKQCFGDVGCTLVVQPSLTYTGTSDLDGLLCDVTYEVTGDESGPVIETASGDGTGQYEVMQSMLSTPSSSTAVEATVQRVSCL